MCEKKQQELLGRLVEDLITLSHKVVDKQSELTNEQNNIQELIEGMQETVDQLILELYGSGHNIGAFEQIRSHGDRLKNHQKFINQAETDHKEIDKIKTRQNVQWWILGGVGILLIAVFFKWFVGLIGLPALLLLYY